MIIGIDVSLAQGIINWDQVQATNQVSFVFCKATEGVTFVDPQYKTNWQAIKDHGWLRGCYHFARTSNDPVKEADHFISTLGDLDPTDMLVLDIETSALKGDDFIQWVLSWCSEVQSKTGHTPWIYTGGPFWVGCAPTVSDDVAAQLQTYPLWLAAYTNSPDKYVPGAWKSVGWKLWQRSGDVAPSGFSVLHLPGVHGNVDCDVWNGTLEELQTLAASLSSSAPAASDPAPVTDPGAQWEESKT